MKLTKLFVDFFESERAGGLILIACTVVSILIANSVVGDVYIDGWNYKVAGHTWVHWINDGLMAIFFLLIGLELEREVYIGELSGIKKAALPVLAAFGGMLIPAGIYLMFNMGLPTQDGAGIPMATDIAFAIGVLSLLGSKVPSSLKILLMALAVIDDLGAILVIAFFYSSDLSILNLSIALGIFGFLLLMNRLKVKQLFLYLLFGFAMWYFMLHSGVHATIAGVMLAFAIPFEDGKKKSMSYRLQHFLHKPVAFVILPLFALANTCLILGDDWIAGLDDPGSIGVLAGLIVGKPMGVMLFSIVAVAAGLCKMPADLKWKHIFGVGMLAGIGFTMSIFISLLAYEDSTLIDQSKIAILLASLVSAIAGFIWLKLSLKNNRKPVEPLNIS
jgi:NhaA family Na+:H+ antiporter